MTDQMIEETSDDPICTRCGEEFSNYGDTWMTTCGRCTAEIEGEEPDKIDDVEAMEIAYAEEFDAIADREAVVRKQNRW